MFNVYNLPAIVAASIIKSQTLEATFTVTVPTGTVSSNLTDFPLMIDLSLMPPAFWTSVRNDGGNVRVYAADGVTMIPHDLSYIQKDRQLGRLFAKTTLLTASDNLITVKLISLSELELAIGDTNGRNAVWADYEVVIVYPETVNRTGNVYTRVTNEVAFSEWKRTDYFVMTGSPHQGLAVDASNNIVTIDTNYLRRSTVAAPNIVLASNANPVAAAIAATGNTFLNHCSAGCIIAGEFWVPINEYPITGGVKKEFLCVFNLSTLALDRHYDVSSVNRHISAISPDADRGTIWATDFLNGASLIQFNTSGTLLGTVALSATIVELQGLAFVEGSIFLAADATDITKVSKTGVIDVAIGNEFQNPQTGGSEGISYSGGKLYHMDTGGDMTVLEKVDALADWGRLHYNVHYETYPRSTSWSMGASIYWADTTGDMQQGFLSMSNGASSSQRATAAYRTSSNRLSLWNSTDGWLESDIDLAYKDTFRLAVKHDGTTQRKLFYNGILKATDNAVSARPSGTGTDMSFVVNASDVAAGEDGEGLYQFVWARSDYVSDDWMIADGENNLTPNTFYTIT